MRFCQNTDHVDRPNKSFWLSDFLAGNYRIYIYIYIHIFENMDEPRHLVVHWASSRTFFQRSVVLLHGLYWNMLVTGFSASTMLRGNKDGDELAVEHLLGATLIPNEAIFESSQSSREPRDEDMKCLGKMGLDGDGAEKETSIQKILCWSSSYDRYKIKTKDHRQWLSAILSTSWVGKATIGDLTSVLPFFCKYQKGSTCM